MATVDFHTQPGLGRSGLRERLTALRSEANADPVSVVMPRVVFTDTVMALVALAVAAQALLVDLVGWSLLAPVLWPVALVRVGAYDGYRLVVQGLMPSILVRAASLVALGIGVAGLIFTEVSVREWWRLTALLFATTLLGRALVARWVTRSQRAGRLQMPVLVRGPASEVRHYLEMVAQDPAPALSVVAVQTSDEGEVANAPARASLVPDGADPTWAAVHYGVRAVVMVGPIELSSDVLRRTIWDCEQHGIQTMMLPIVEPVAPPQVAATRRGPVSMVFSGPNRRLFGIKGLVDRVLAGLGLVLLSPLMVVIGLLIRGTSSGPVLFRQRRVGRGGEEFTMLKFRTMVEDAEALRADLEALNPHDGGTLFKVRDDPRVTPVGRVLRKFSLDEIPQLINVVRGEMSLVGPRPSLPEEVANYPADYRRRFAVNPGMTGLWQVSGRSNLDATSSARLDTQYVENWSFALDLRILVKTVKVVFSGTGAY